MLKSDLWGGGFIKMRKYLVLFKMYYADFEHAVDVCAKNKIDAYEKAVYIVIPKEFGSPPYSAWVDSVKCKNGNRKKFNTMESVPF